jgi:nitrous oxidase accessory protein
MKKSHYKKIITIGTFFLLIGLSYTVIIPTTTDADDDFENKKTNEGERGRGFEITLDKAIWNPDTKQWVNSLNLGGVKDFEETIKVRIKITNTGDICTSPYDAYINIIDGIDLGETTASATFNWGGDQILISDSTYLTSDYPVSYQMDMASFFYQHDAWPSEVAMPETSQPIVQNNCFSWNWTITPFFQPDSSLFLFYELNWTAEYFIHVTDIHWGEDRMTSNPPYKQGYTNWYNFVCGVTSPWDADHLPKFILVSGDIVEYGAGQYGRLLFDSFMTGSDTIAGSPGNWHVKLQTSQGIRTVPIRFAPGNHDLRYPWQLGGGSTDGYLESIFWNLHPSHLYYMDQWLDPEYVRVFSLNSGFDDLSSFRGNLMLPEGDGLYSWDLDRLEADLDSLDGITNGEDNSDYLKIIMFHHPYENINGGFGALMDGAFLNNRARFITICNAYNVDLVLWGHTHQPNWGTIRGTSTLYNDGGSLRDGASFTKIYYRPKNPDTSRGGGNYPLMISNGIFLRSTLSLEVEGRAKADAYDELGGHTGLIEADHIIEAEINESSCSVWTWINETLGINTTATEIYLEKNDLKDYRFIIEGLADDTIHVTISINLQSENLFGGNSVRSNIIAFYENVTMFEGSRAVIEVNKSLADYQIIITDPDGTIRKVLPSRWDYEGDPITVVVDDDFNSDTPGWNEICFATITDGMNTVTKNGNVFVYPGMYYENLVINKPLHLYGKNKEATIIHGENGADDTIQITTENVTISGFTIQNSMSFYDGIDICSNHNIITDNTITSNAYGISIHGASYNIVSKNSIQDNDRGISFDNGASKNTILENTITDNTYDGISLYDSFQNTITENTVENNNYGINVYAGDDNLIARNKVMNNNCSGIYMYYSNQNNITDNTIINNGINEGYNRYGVYLQSSIGNTIIENIIKSNKDYGIYLDYGTNTNTIYHNTFINNNVQGYDSGVDNVWSNGYPSGGNFWNEHEYHDNFTGENQDVYDPVGDGIVDQPGGGLNSYTIDGTSDSQDNYPFVHYPLGVNQPPNKPYVSGWRQLQDTMTGSYYATADDPEGDRIYYNFSWGDGTYSGWLGPFLSGHGCQLSHSWPSGSGVYYLRVQAKDLSGTTGPWSSRFKVSVYTCIIIPGIHPHLKEMEPELGGGG